MAASPFKLPVPQWLKRIRELADEAEAFAATMNTSELRDGYLNIASRWRTWPGSSKGRRAAPAMKPSERQPMQSPKGESRP